MKKSWGRPGAQGPGKQIATSVLHFSRHGTGQALVTTKLSMASDMNSVVTPTVLLLLRLAGSDPPLLFLFFNFIFL